LLREARASLAGYLGTERDNLVYVTNVTVALNIVTHSLTLRAGDEVLASDMEYGAIDRTWRFLAQKQGFKYINQPLSVPVVDRAHLIEDLWEGVTPRTKVITLSHISSPTAMIFPVKEICHMARERGILTVIDGAHAPGQIDLDLEDIGADFYGGNCHKWMCSPKGAGFLYAAPSVQHLVEPLVVSWGWQSETPGPSQFVDYQEWSGTRDISAFLAVPEAIRYLEAHHWDQVQHACHDLARQAVERICRISGLSPLYPLTSEWFSQMAVAPLKESADPVNLQARLREQYHIEVPVLRWNGYKLVRLSVQAYNTPQDLYCLVSALEKLTP